MGLMFSDLTGPKLKKMLGANRALRRYHNKNKSGGNFGINIYTEGKGSFEINGRYNPNGEIISIDIGRLWGTPTRYRVLGVSKEEVIGLIKQKYQQVISGDIHAAESFSANTDRHLNKPNCKCGAVLQWNSVKAAWYCIECDFNTYPKGAEGYEFVMTDWQSAIDPKNRPNNDEWFVTGDISFALPDEKGNYGRGVESISLISTFGVGATIEDAKEDGKNRAVEWLKEESPISLKSESLKFKDWADQEMKTHGKDDEFDDWVAHEVDKHGNMNLKDWGEYEERSHTKRYGVENESFPAPSWTEFETKLDKQLERMIDETHELNKKGEWPHGKPFKVFRKEPEFIDVELNVEQGPDDYGFDEYAYGMNAHNLESQLREDSKRNNALNHVSEATIHYYPKGEYNPYASRGSYNWNPAKINEDSPLIEVIFPNDMKTDKNTLLIRPCIDWDYGERWGEEGDKADELYYEIYRDFVPRHRFIAEGDSLPWGWIGGAFVLGLFVPHLSSFLNSGRDK